MNRRHMVSSVAAVLLAVALVGPTLAVPGPQPGSSSAERAPAHAAAAQPAVKAAVDPAALPASPTDESKVPHYFGPYSNWANSPQVLANAIVTIGLGTPTPATYGNPLTGRAHATDYAAAVSQPVVDPAVTLAGAGYNVTAGNATGGTFTLTADALTTGNIAFDATAVDVEAALVAAGVSATVAGTAPWVVTFAAAPATFTINGAALTYPAPLQPVLVVVPTPLPNGNLSNFQTWNQVELGTSPFPSAGQTFHAYVLRLVVGTTDQYNVVFDSGPLAVPAPSVAGMSEIATFTTGAPVAVAAGDVIAFYGAGIPADTGAGADLFSYPAPAAPAQGATITLGGTAFPLFGQARTYSFAATVTPTVVDPGTGATATATVNPRTGAISAITVTSPGNGYVLPPTVTITSPGITPTALASATAAISTGVVTAITVNEAGFNYTAPTVTISGGGIPSVPATAQAVGSVDVVNVTAGGFYTIQPVVEFSLPDDAVNGRRATGVAELDIAGAVTDVVVIDPGTGYYTAPIVNIWDGTANVSAPTPATATAVLRLDGVMITNGGAGYDSLPAVTIADSLGGIGDGATATAVLSTKGAVTGITVTRAGAGYLTPGIKKFVDTLAGLNPAGANNLGNFIPVGVADTITYPGTDYYEIGLVQYRHQFHSSLLPTLMRGYVQLSTGVVPGAREQLTNANLVSTVPATQITGQFGVTAPHYLGPTIVATKDRPVRITFRNLLPTGAEGNLFLPTDTTLMGSGMGPNMVELDPVTKVPVEMLGNGTVMDAVRNPTCGADVKLSTCFSENRATLHLHGGITPWISDGTPHQWTTPAGEATDYPKGVSVSNVPDMPDPGPGAITFFYTNQQSARLMFYHDHAWGITRLNVYAGEAAGYIITDEAEAKLVTDGLLPDAGSTIPLIIQDKTFVPANILTTDPTWDSAKWGGVGSLWAPHVYMPAQNPGDPSGMSSFGRWMYGPWFWPPATNAKYGPIANPYYDPLCDPATVVGGFCEPALIPGTPNISVGMEAFNDTPIVNGTAYPKVTVDPKAYRMRVLNAANDRFWNLSWYVADPRTGTLSEVALNPAELAAAQTDPVVSPTPDTTWSPKGPNWIFIGSEGGFVPKPVVVPAQPTTWITDATRFDVGNVDQHSLLLAPAERADTIVDFSQFRGKTLILFNDAPAAFPARVPQYDYYTGGPDLSPVGAPPTLPGYGPNTRTIMQIKVSNATPATAYDRPGTTIDKLGQLTSAFLHRPDGSGVFESSQNPIIVGQAEYNEAYGTNFVANGWCNGPTPSAKCDGLMRINEQGGNFFKFDTLGPLKDGNGPQLAVKIEPKGIHDEMNSATFDEFGRMTANMGLEAPGITPLLQNIILYPYVNPATEILDATSPALPKGMDVTPISVASDGTQIWKITHNGVDTHPIHFHLYDVQVLNRVAWDNNIIATDPQELGWKETVRVSPLQDTIVAIRPIIPELPFGVPNSERLLNPMMPEGARGSKNGVEGTEAGFNNTNALGHPIAPIVNEMTNLEWEYVFHCHILSHEEMDMMRPVLVKVATTLPDAPVLTLTLGSVILTWTDGTPIDYEASPATWGNPKNEIGYRVQRAVFTGSVLGAYETIAATPANKTTFTGATPDPAFVYAYRVVAFNASGDSPSNIVAPPVASLAPASLAFGSVTTGTASASQTVTVSNTGASDLAVTGATLVGANPGEFSLANNCTTVAPAGSCTISVAFAPTAVGAASATLSIAHNAAGTPSLVTLTGTGVLPPPPTTFSVPPTQYLGSKAVGTSTLKTVLVTNTGTATLFITSASAPAPFSTVTLGTCASPVNVGKTCKLNVTFAPTTTGPLSATLTVVSSNATNSPRTTILTGTGR